MSPTQLARHLEISNNAAAYHCRVLQQLGAIEVVDMQPARGAHQIFFGVTSPRLATDDAAHASTESALAELHTEAWSAAARGGFDRWDSLIKHKSARLDPQGRRALNRVVRAFLDRLREIEDEAERRVASGQLGADPKQVDVVVLAFETTAFARPTRTSDDEDSALPDDPGP